MKLYNKIVIKPLLSVFETLIQNITTNTNQQYKGLQRFNAEVISSAIDLLSNFSYISEEFKQLVDKNNNLLMLYNRLVHFIIPITEEQTNTSQKSDENLMDTVDIPEYQSRTATPFRALEHLRNNLRWKKHTTEITELVDVLNTFYTLFLHKFIVINNYITRQVENIEYITTTSKPHVGGKTKRRRKTNKKTKHRRY